MRPVIVHELRSQLDPFAVDLIDEARELGVEVETMRATRRFSAVVEHDGRRELWAISEDDARRIAAECRSAEPPLINLPEPARVGAAGWDARLLFT